MNGAIVTKTGPAAVDASPALAIEETVLDRYRKGARQAQPDLCCPIDYEKKYLELLPEEIAAKDYGCGDPSAYVFEGERALDLGSGGGKICYILSQKVGPQGSVIGVDFNDEMLALARKYLPEMEDKLGYGNVSFRKGRIQDLALDLEGVQAWLDGHPIESVEQVQAFETACHRLREKEPLIPDGSIDVVVSNCVLNLVRPEDRQQLFKEIHRVLRRGGRAVVSDIVCDEIPGPSIRNDPELWSGCIAGAFREDRFLQLFEETGFYGVEIVARQDEPWRVVEGIEFRSMTVRVYKGKEGPCMERNQAALYKGPWKSVTDDDGHTYHRGTRAAVCDKTFGILTDPEGPYSQDIHAVSPRKEVPEERAVPWQTGRPPLRHPRESKGMDYELTTEGSGGPCDGPACC